LRSTGSRSDEPCGVNEVALPVQIDDDMRRAAPPGVRHFSERAPNIIV
jgi:hypothetical protein